MRRVRAGLGLVGVCLVVAGWLGGAFVTSSNIDGTPREVMPAGDLVAPVTTTEFDDSRIVQLTVSVTEREPLRSNSTGTVTSTSCRPGERLESGTVMGAVDALPVRLLSTSVPLWRSLRAGDTGEDVEAVQGELARLGFEAPATGRVDGATTSAVRTWLTSGDWQLWRAYQGNDHDLVLSLASVVWSPERSVTPMSCELRPGASVAAGDVMLTPTPEVGSVTLASPMPELSGRSRALTVGDVTVAVDNTGAVADPDDVAALAATPEFAAWLESEGEERRLSGTLALDTPVTVGSVPPAALVGLSTGEPCLVDRDGGVTPVVVVSSRLGQSLVTPVSPGGALPAQVVVDRTGSRRCASP